MNWKVRKTESQYITHSSHSPDRSAVPILLGVVFFSYAGFSLPFPVLTPLFLSEDVPFLAAGWSTEQRAILLGLAFSLYALGQFAGSLFLGALSDTWGRKKTLQMALCGSVFGYFITALGVWCFGLSVFLLGRAVTGFCEGSAGITQAALANLSSKENRIRVFSHVNTACGLGWIAGPLLGGLLSSYSLFGLSPYGSLFCFCALISGGMLLCVSLTLGESYAPSRESLMDSYRSLRTTLASSRVKLVYLANLFVVIGFACFQQFFPAFLMGRYACTDLEISYAYTFLATVWVLAQQAVVTPLSDYWSAPIALARYCIILSLAYVLVCTMTSPWLLLVSIPLVAIGASGALTTAVGMVSVEVRSELQGSALGLNRAVHSLGRAVPSVFAGYLLGIHVALPILAGLLFALAAAGTGVLCARRGVPVCTSTPSIAS